MATNSDFPPSYECVQEALDRRDVGYDDFLTRSSGFINPTNVSQLASELGITPKVDSLFDSLRHGCPPSECAPALRKRQNASVAFGHVAAGIRHFKSGNNIEAFQCLNQALKIDAENVEGLVARGALYANNGSLEKAILDFEDALKFNPTHRNATKYLSETLVALARQFEEEKNVEEASRAYIKILQRVPDHGEALERLRILKGLPTGHVAGLDPTKPWEMREKLRFSLSGNDEEQRRSGKKAKRSRSGSSSSASSASSSGWSSSSQRGKKKRGKKRRRSKRDDKRRRSSSPEIIEERPAAAASSSERPLSPFSQKMHLLQNHRPENPALDGSGINLAALAERGQDPRIERQQQKVSTPPPGEEAAISTTAAVSMPDLSKPPPSYSMPGTSYEYNPAAYVQQQRVISDTNYDLAVREFLEKTTGKPPPPGLFPSGKRSESPSRRRRSRSRSREGRSRESKRSSSPKGRKSKEDARTKKKKRRSSSSSSSSSSDGDRGRKKKKDKADSKKSSRGDKKRKKDLPGLDKEEMKQKAKMIADLAKMGVNSNMEEFAAKMVEYVKETKEKAPYLQAVNTFLPFANKDFAVNSFLI